MALDRGRIVDEAMGILDEFGLGDVSMRRIARGLGVQPGALYWHFETKQELIAALAGRIVEPVLAAAPWPDAGELARALRRAVLAHRDGSEVLTAGMALPGLYARLLSAARDAVGGDVAEPARSAGAAALLHVVVGAVAREQAGAQLDAATGQSAPERPDPAAEFEDSLHVVLAGIGASARRG